MSERAIIYTRVSTVEQADGYSLQTQLERCREYALEAGMVVIGDFSDQHTGTELNRPGLTKLLDFVVEQRPDALIVYDLDRFSRSSIDQAILEMHLKQAGVTVHYVLGNYADTPEGQLNKTIKAAIAEYENRQRVERSQRGRRAKAKAGHVIASKARPPYGYRYVKDEQRYGHFEIDPEEAAVVRRIYGWVLDGKSSYTIARLLSEQGVPTRGDRVEAVVKKNGVGLWAPRTITKIVANATNRGLWHYGKTKRVKQNGTVRYEPVPPEEWIAVPVPAIVDDETWHQAQMQLDRNRRQAKRNAKRQYLLRGMIRCRCGLTWWGKYKTNAGLAYYNCPSKEARQWLHDCDIGGGIRQELLEGVVWGKVSECVLDPDHLRLELERRRANADVEQQRFTARLQAVEGSLSETQRKLGLLLDEFLGDFPAEVVQERKQLLLRQREALEKEQARLQTEVHAGALSAQQEQSILDFAAEVKVGLTDMSFEKKRRMLELLQVEVEIISQTEIRIKAVVGLDDGVVGLGKSETERLPADQDGSVAGTTLLENLRGMSTSRWRGRWSLPDLPAAGAESPSCVYRILEAHRERGHPDAQG